MIRQEGQNEIRKRGKTRHRPSCCNHELTIVVASEKYSCSIESINKTICDFVVQSMGGSKPKC